MQIATLNPEIGPAARPAWYRHAVPLMVAILVSVTLIVTDAAWYKGHYLNQFARMLRTLI